MFWESLGGVKTYSKKRFLSQNFLDKIKYSNPGGEQTNHRLLYDKNCRKDSHCSIAYVYLYFKSLDCSLIIG